MASFLCVAWDGGGTVPPMLGLVRMLVEAGHDVRVLGERHLGPRVEMHDARFVPFERAPITDPTRAVEDQVGEYLGMWFDAGAGEDLVAELDREAADVVVIDCQFGALNAFAEARGVKTAVLVHLLYQAIVDGRWLDGWRFAIQPTNAVRRKLGLDAFDPALRLYEQVWGRADRVIVASAESFDYPGTKPDNVTYVGPIREGRVAQGGERYDVMGGDPLVVVSLSTSYMNQEELLTKVMYALDGLGVQALVTTGPRIDPASLPEIDGIVVRASVPHERVMPEASLVITHGGHGTVMVALEHGVPIVCIPMGREQDLNAERVEACGVGRTVAFDAPAQVLRATIEDVRSSEAYREAARRMSEDVRSYDGGRRAVAALEALLDGEARRGEPGIGQPSG